MKKLICLTLCLLMLFSFSACGKQKDVYKTGTVSNDVQISVIDDNNVVWLSNPDFEKISVKLNKDGIYYLEFKTTKDGKKALLETTKANEDKTLTFLANDVLLLTVAVAEPIKNGVFTYSSNTLDPVYAFNILTNEPDRTTGLVKPKNVITPQKAKGIAFKKAAVDEKQITDLECELEFDEDWRGWEYEISFEFYEKEFEFEINAFTGVILNFKA